VHRGNWPVRIRAGSAFHPEILLGTIIAWWSSPGETDWVARVVVQPHDIEEILPGSRLELASEEEAYLVSHPAVGPDEASATNPRVTTEEMTFWNPTEDDLAVDDTDARCRLESESRKHFTSERDPDGLPCG